MKSVKMRLICGVIAGAVVLGSFAVPTLVRADDIDDYLDDFEDLTDDELEVLRNLQDYDNDQDLDEDDVEYFETLMLLDSLNDYSKQKEAEAENARRQAEQAQKAQQAQQAQIAAQQAQIEALKRDKNRYVSVTGVYVSTTEVVLIPGQTYQIIAGVVPDNANNRGVSFSTSDPNVAHVDGSGIVKGMNPGSCIITARTNENGYTARTAVKVNPAPAVVAQTISDDATWMQAASTMILAAAPGAVVNLAALKPMNFDANVINALKARPDVGLLVAYPYNGRNYLMAIPAGYNLAAKMDKTGKVSFLSLAAAKDNKIVVKPM